MRTIPAETVNGTPCSIYFIFYSRMGCAVSKSVASSVAGSKVSLENGSNTLKTTNHHPSNLYNKSSCLAPTLGVT